MGSPSSITLARPGLPPPARRRAVQWRASRPHLAARAVMFWTSRLSLSSLIELCRVVRHYLGAGLTLQDVFRQQAQRGPQAVRPVAQRVITALDNGATFEEALRPERGVLPPLLVSLASVGEKTGMLPEVFH